MKLSKIIRIYIGILMIIVFIGMFVDDSVITVYAKEDLIFLTGLQYGFDKSSHYEFANAEITNEIDRFSQFGRLSVLGDIKPISDVNGIAAYEVIEGNVVCSYVHEENSNAEQESSIEFVDDKTKKIDDIEINSNIGNCETSTQS